jgi:hypothetical protein
MLVIYTAMNARRIKMRILIALLTIASCELPGICANYEDHIAIDVDRVCCQFSTTFMQVCGTLPPGR